MLAHWKTVTTVALLALGASSASAQSVTTSATPASVPTPALHLLLMSFGTMQPASFAVPSLAVDAAVSQLMSDDQAEADTSGSTSILPGAFGSTGISTGLPAGRGGVGNRNPFARRNANTRSPSQNHGRRGGGSGAGGGHGGGVHRPRVPHVPSTGLRSPVGR